MASPANKSANKPNYQLANELLKPIIKKFKKRHFIRDLETIFEVKYLLCGTDLFSKYA